MLPQVLLTVKCCPHLMMLRKVRVYSLNLCKMLIFQTVTTIKKKAQRNQ